MSPALRWLLQQLELCWHPEMLFLSPRWLCWGQCGWHCVLWDTQLMEEMLQWHSDSGTLSAAPWCDVPGWECCCSASLLLSEQLWGVSEFISGLFWACTLHIPCGLGCTLRGLQCQGLHFCFVLPSLFRVFPRAHLVCPSDTALPSVLKVTGSHQMPGVHLGVPVWISVPLDLHISYSVFISFCPKGLLIILIRESRCFFFSPGLTSIPHKTGYNESFLDFFFLALLFKWVSWS